MYPNGKDMNVKSRNIRSIDYSRNTHELFIVFLNRPRLTYIYKNVYPQVWTKFVKAESKGEFFASRIKDNYSYTIRNNYANDNKNI